MMTQPPPRTRVGVVDDHELIAAGAAATFAALEDVHLVASATTVAGLSLIHI